MSKHCTKSAIVQALREVKDGESMDSVTKQCVIFRTPLRSRIKGNGGGEVPKQRDRKTVFCLETEEKVGAATTRTAELAFGLITFAFRGIFQNYVNAKDFATPFQDGLLRYDWNIDFMDGLNITVEWGADEGSAQAEFAVLLN